MVTSARDVCYRCHKPVVVCVCADVPKVANRTEVVIVQHPREQFHPIGTVRFAKLGLDRVRVLVRHPRERVEDPRVVLGDVPAHRAGVLYPSRTSRVLSELAPDERPEVLVVLDGTWHEAKSLYRENPWLAHLPGYHLAPKEKGRYRIRKEPTDESLSTIEAITQALAALEPDTPGLDALIGAFDRMIDRQIAYAADPHPRSKAYKLKRPAIPIPEILRRSPEKIVVAYGEHALPADGSGGAGYDLIYWTGVRLATGETFAEFARPPGLEAGRPPDEHLRHMGLDRRTLEGGLPAAEIAERWRKFLGDDVLAVWNRSTLDFLGPSWPSASADPLILKTAWANARKRRAGGIEDVVASEGLEPAPVPFVGRAGEVMGRLVAVTRRLIELGR